MRRYKKRNIFDTFFSNRSSLIVQYANGDITKKEFLEANFDFVQKMRIKPFKIIDSFEKGMYNYQYYNTLAKYYKMLANDMRNSTDYSKDNYNKDFNYKEYNYYKNMGNEYYNEKDRTTYQLLKHLKFENVDAYFVNVESKNLKNKLYEIVLLDYKEAIFHSKSLWLLKILKKENVFIEGQKDSLIEHYINDRY